MRKIYFMSCLFSLVLTQSAFASTMPWNSDGSACMSVASACRAAGFDRNNQFWMHCMQPIILGKTVKGVSVDEKIVTNCRADKIARMKKELAELESVK